MTELPSMSITITTKDVYKNEESLDEINSTTFTSVLENSLQHVKTEKEQIF